MLLKRLGDNIIQIVTNNATNYKARDLLMQKRKKLYWTPCATHCIDLILEDFEKKMLSIKRPYLMVRKSQPTYI